MWQRFSGIALALGVLLVGVSPASAQLFNFPFYAVPSANGAPSTFFAGTYGRGLSDSSGKADSYGAVIGRTGEAAWFGGGRGVGDGGGDSELTRGASVGVDLVEGESATVAFNGGFGWTGPGDATFLRFPLGIAIKGAVQSPEALITPWVMPRLEIMRVSASGFSSTDSELGASAGVGFTFSSGFGLHTALDAVFADNTVWLFGIGGHYMVGSGN